MTAVRGWLLAALLLAAGCTGDREPTRTVVVYTALDNVFSRQVFDRFTERTGIRVDAVFDTEATKTTGLVERIRREHRRPLCDVFWNNEILRTIQLGTEGLLAPYSSPSSADVPDHFKDPTGLWTGFAARARALAFRLDRVPQGSVPKTHDEILAEGWRGAVSLADPRFGTTGSHFAILLAAWGEPRFQTYVAALRDLGVQVVSGNATSRDRVVAGEVLLGFTDTDDIEVARRRGEPISGTLLDGDGVVVIPNTVALVKGGPHPAEARELIDFLLSPEVEEWLASSSSRQIPLRSAVPVPATGLSLRGMKVFPADYVRAAELLPRALEIFREVWGR
ncbi:MAG: extracellular solute-binding protein [Planctomycetota bacterium]